MSVESPQNEEKDKKISGKRRIAIVDTSEALEEQARDLAEERMTASKEELEGMKGFFSKIWKHNLFQEYYRQKEIALAKGEISESGNLYVGEGADQATHEQAMSAIVERFVQEYEETIHTEAGEERKVVGNEKAEEQQLNLSVRALIREYASGSLDDQSFNEERHRIIADATGFSDEKLKNAVNHTDNLFEIAKQSRMAVKHGASLEEIDQEIELVVGKAKVGVRTESNYNLVDRIAEKIQSSQIGKFVNETTIASGVAIAYLSTVGFSQRLARSSTLAWGTFGAAALVGGVIAGARESVKVEDERRQHSRERAKGKEMTPEMERRMEMEKTTYKTIPAKSLHESIISLSNKINGPEDFFGALNVLAETESRIKLSDRENIDLISYSDFKSIEQERLNLDLARAEAKVKLRRIITDGLIELPDGKTFDEFYESTIDVQTTGLYEGNEGMEMKDRLFKKMKSRKIAGAVVKAAVTGLVVGGLAQETSAFFSEGQEGFVERALGGRKDQTESVTALAGLRQWIEGEKIAGRAIHHVTLPDGSNVNLPDGVDLAPNPQSSDGFIFTKDGEVISDKIQFSDGKLTQAAEEILKQNEVQINNAVTSVTSHEEVVIGPKDMVDKNPEIFHKIHRKFWYDNDTPQFDLNELKTHYGGVSGTGLDSQGNYVMNVSKMTPEGSFHQDLSVDAQETMKAGKLKMLLSLSKDSQSNVVEVPIDEYGNAIVDPNSDIAKMFFKNENGQLKFIGKFMEIGQSIGPAEDGAEQFNLLSTVVGPGQETFTTVKDVMVDTPVTSFEVTDHLPYVEPPIFLPIFGRRPLEKMGHKLGQKEIILPAYYFGGSGFETSENQKEQYEKERSKTLKENPDATLDQFSEIDSYLKKQNPDYTETLKEVAKEMGPIDKECRLSVCIPVAGHQEGENIYHTLENYSRQTIDHKKFEIVLFVNRPDVDKEGKQVAPDETMAEIKRFMKDNPDIKIRVCEQILPIEKTKIGYIRKVMNDAVLLRQRHRGEAAPELFIVSNDADNKGVAPQYIENFVSKFDENPEADSMIGQLDWDPNSYIKNPLIHIGTRLFQYEEAQSRYKGWHCNSSGANFAFRSSIYAAVGGYSDKVSGGEDTDFGARISASRRGAINKKPIIYAGSRVSRLYTSSRRAEMVMEKFGLSPLEQWDKGFGAFDDEVRKINWQNNKEIDYENEEEVKKLTDALETVINRTIKRTEQWGGSTNNPTLKRSLGWLGIKYEITGTHSIRIVDASKLIKGLKQYKDEASEILARKTRSIT